jgi:hypothetical protein
MRIIRLRRTDGRFPTGLLRTAHRYFRPDRLHDGPHRKVGPLRSDQNLPAEREPFDLDPQASPQREHKRSGLYKPFKLGRISQPGPENGPIKQSLIQGGDISALGEVPTGSPSTFVPNDMGRRPFVGNNAGPVCRIRPLKTARRARRYPCRMESRSQHDQPKKPSFHHTPPLPFGPGLSPGSRLSGAPRTRRGNANAIFSAAKPFFGLRNNDKTRDQRCPEQPLAKHLCRKHAKATVRLFILLIQSVNLEMELRKELKIRYVRPHIGKKTATTIRKKGKKIG